jgi:hypothetical protein
MKKVIQKVKIYARSCNSRRESWIDLTLLEKKYLFLYLTDPVIKENYNIKGF